MDSTNTNNQQFGYNGNIELLAPAGNYSAFVGAVNAGADAVYLAGKMFGARAYADNFGDEELLRALDYAHIHGSKIYMTVNTLLKNKEIDLLCDYIAPFYKEGLDGCIIQDMGVFRVLKDNFPGMELHASTQMTVSSMEGAKYLKNKGFDRIVLSRELKAGEIQEITRIGIDTECFIHGSMCYCYSGQCLYSSLVGGRSGNRGRCAQPCRLKYSYNGKEGYYLSLKDMCTVNMLPEVIKLGIHSYKIEGRMKHESYAAGVTSIYRKYIDRILSNPDKEYLVDKEDLEILSNLYIRSEIGSGYYTKDRGKNMITFNLPSYAKTDDTLIKEISDRFCFENKALVNASADFKKGQNSEMTIMSQSGDKVYKETGDIVSPALKMPVTKEDAIKKLGKTGDSLFRFANLSVSVDEDAFIPVGRINELRRNALEGYKNMILSEYKRKVPDSFIKPSYETYNKKNISSKVIYFAGDADTARILSYLGVACCCIPLYDYVEDLKFDEIYIELPEVVRNENIPEIEEILRKVFKNPCLKGFYVNQYDSLALIKEFVTLNSLDLSKYEICGDIHLYKFNNVSFDGECDYYTVPLELKIDELKHLDLSFGEMFIYGKYPLMNTANCILNTASECRKYKPSNDYKYLKDRYGKDILVKTHCKQKICYNTLYNCVPTSLHNCFDKIKDLKISRYQIRFTDEDESRIKEVIALFESLINGQASDNVSYEYTNGHSFRGVE